MRIIREEQKIMERVLEFYILGILSHFEMSCKYLLMVYHFIFLLSLMCCFFQVVMYRCESWTVKKAERRRIDAFELWCWRRLLRAPWTARRSNQSILKEIGPGISLEGIMLKLKL